MSGNRHHQPPQPAGKAQRLRSQLARPTLGLHHDFGMQPDPHMAPHPRHADTQQAQGRLTTAGMHAGLMRLPVGRLHATTTAIGGAHPRPGAMRQPPGGIQQRLSLLASPLAACVVTDDRQVKVDVALLRALQGLGGPMTLFRGRPCIGAGGASHRGGFFTTFDSGHEEGQLRRDQSAHHPHPVKAAVERHKLHPHTPRDPTGKEGSYHVGHGLLGPHAAQGQGIAAPPDHGIGRGLGEKVGRTTLGLAAADLVWMGLIYRPMVGQRDHIQGYSASTFPQARGHQLGQEVIEMACECIQVAELARQVAQHDRSRRSPCKLVTGLMDRAPGGGSKAQDPQQVPACNSPGHLQGQGVARVDGEGIHVLAFQGILRICRHRSSPIGLRELVFSSRYRRGLCFL